MYEALLRLEREGCAVVDRAMTHPADLALSASACAAVWTEDALQARIADAPDLAPRLSPQRRYPACTLHDMTFCYLVAAAVF
jgi:hypothetical protein